jgi:Asp-tRNA(Asn)/Glu-tRNA(Gln) amidotransferase A subunit family amidase
MINLQNKRTTDFFNIYKSLCKCNSIPKLTDFYEKFTSNYLSLNNKYKFSECFSKDFLDQQIEKLYSYNNGALYGIPFGVKDVFNTQVLPTTMGSKIWSGFKAGNNARIVDEIVDRGGIVFSKTTTAEFAVHYIDEGKTINPYNANHITGTSSAGSAVAVATGALPIALATQTAGSIIRPASFCNVFGFKPSFGAIDRTGTLKTADSLDTIGFIGSDIYGIRKTFVSIFQKEIENNYYAKNYFAHYRKYKDKNDLQIGVVSNTFAGYANYDLYVQDALELFIKQLSLSADMNVNVKEAAGIEFINEIHPLHEVIYCKSLSYYFKEEFSHGIGLSEVMSNMIEVGNKIAEKDYINALNNQPTYRDKFDSIFNKYDFLITPSTASVAPLIGDREKEDTCLIWTFLGYPVLNLPIFLSKEKNLPFGLQVIAPRFGDLSLLDFGDRILLDLKPFSGSTLEVEIV